MTVNLKRLFRIKSLKGKNMCMLQGVDKPIDTSDLLPVLINSKYDRNIYYDPVVAGSIIALEQSKSTLHIDYRNYLEAFKDSKVNDKTMLDLIKQHGFCFVHEIQDWLRNFHDDNLKIKANGQRI
jgi:hypothetical protein